jgi:YD repeat-containing protein
VSQSVEVYTQFPWGKELTLRVLGTGSSSLTNQWFFYTNTSDYNDYSYLKEIIEPTGRWETYSYDGYGNVTQMVSQVMNSAAGSANSLNKVVNTTYNTSPPFVTAITLLLGAEVARSYRNYTNGWVENIQCQRAGASYTDASNLVTQTFYAGASGTNDVQSIINADGTVELFSYYTNLAQTYKTNVVAAGQAGTRSGVTVVTNGTLAISVVDFYGNPVSTTMVDILSGLTNQTLTYSNPDFLDRPQTTTYTDGSTSTIEYDYCCGIGLSTDRDGVTTTNVYDALRRLQSSVRLGISNFFYYDAAGHTIAAIRQGTDGSTVTSSAGFDTAGREINATNALGGWTSIGYSYLANGQNVRTTTNPDLGTQIQVFYLDGSVATNMGTAARLCRYVEGVVATGTGATNAYTAAIRLNSSNADTPETVTNVADFVARPFLTIYGDGSASETTYNKFGQISNQIDPDGVSNLFEFSAKGELSYRAIDLNGNGSIDFSGSDRIDWTTNYVTTDHGTTVAVTQTYTWATNSSSSPLLLSATETSSDGLNVWSISVGNVTNQSACTGPSGGSLGNRTVTVTNADNTYKVSVYQNGRVSSVTLKDSSGSQFGQTSYAYDAHGRVYQITDARNGATVFTFNS